MTDLPSIDDANHCSVRTGCALRSQFVAGFRSSAPYINAHRGQTFVIQFSGATVILIYRLRTRPRLVMPGIRLVLVPGAKPQIDARPAEFSPSLWVPVVTDAQALHVVKEVTGALRVEIEARLSMGPPSAGARIGYAPVTM